VETPLAWTWVTQDEAARAGAAAEDSEGIVNYLIGIAGVEAAVFLRELPGDAGFRLSLRSKERIDVALIAASFGGGGHHNASGCTLAGPLASATDRILAHLRAELGAETLLA
jgi:bifunctional oligoribonuclease and PAP phosphatase NrnA